METTPECIPFLQKHPGMVPLYALFIPPFFFFLSLFHSLRYPTLFFQRDKGKHIVAKAEKHCLDPVPSHHGDEGMAPMHDTFHDGVGSLPGRTFSCNPEISPYLFNGKGMFSGCPVHGCVGILAISTCISLVFVAWYSRYAEINLGIMQ